MGKRYRLRECSENVRNGSCCDWETVRAALEEQVLGLESEFAAKEAAGAEEKDLLISLQQHADVQVAMEALVSWCLFPAIILHLHAIVEMKTITLSNREAAAALLSEIRRPSKSIKLRGEVLLHGLEVGLSKSIEPFQLESILGTMERCCESQLFSHFVLEKFLPDIILARVVLGGDKAASLASHHTLSIFQTPSLGMSVKVQALLQALRYVGTLSHFVQTSIDGLGPNKKQARTQQVLGSFLSQLVGEPGGVLAVIQEMLGNVPHGNIQAFQKVSDLIAGRKENTDAVCAQVVDLFKHVATDKDKARVALVKRTLAILINTLCKRFGTNTVQANVFNPLCPYLNPSSTHQAVSSDVASHEPAIMRELATVHSILDSAPPSVQLLDALQPYLVTVFELYAFSHTSHTRGGGEARALLLLWLEHTAPSAAAMFFRNLASVPYPPGYIAIDPDHVRKFAKHNADGFCVLQANLQPNQDQPSSYLHLQLPRRHPKPVMMSENQTNFQEEEEEDDELGVNLDCKERVAHLMKLSCRNSSVQSAIFKQCIDGIADIFESDHLTYKSLADVEILHAVLQSEQSHAFRLARDVINVQDVVASTARLLTASVSAFGLWTFERDAESKRPASTLGLFALDLCAVAVAIAASLASYDENDQLWGPEKTDTPSRFRILENLVEPLSALTRMNANTIAELAGAADRLEHAALQPIIHAKCSEIVEMALTVRISILTGLDMGHHVNQQQAMNSAGVEEQECDDEIIVLDPIGKKIAEVKHDLSHKEPPIRAMGLDKLRDLVLPKEGQSNLPVPGKAHMDEIVSLLCNALLDEDPYVYLTAIRSLGAVCDANPKEYFSRFVELFMDDNSLPVAARLKLGEVLKLAAHRSGKTLPYYAPRLIRAFLHGASELRSKRDLVSRTDEQGRLVDAKADASKSAGSGTPVLMHELRSSCLANLADVCALAPWAAFQQANTVISLVRGIFTFEKGAVESPSPRRAAAYVLLQLVNGALSLGNLDALHEIPGELKEVLHLANAGSTYDEDPVVRLHCDRARAAIDTLMKQFLFPAEKPKVLKVSLGLDKL